jgi:deoxyribonuclease-2
MGNYFCCCFRKQEPTSTIEIVIQEETEKKQQPPPLPPKKKYAGQIALKFPHGVKGIRYSHGLKDFIEVDINEWLSKLYAKKNCTSYVVYNDETSKLNVKGHKRGHSKGILAWNDQNITWLCHSVPNFPRSFDGVNISPIEPGEEIYGQSFQYVCMDYTSELLSNILLQLYIMEVHIFIEKMSFINAISIHYKVFNLTKTITLVQNEDEMIEHVAKSPGCHIDIYSDHICKIYEYEWKVETWIRGHRIHADEDDTDKRIHDIDTIQYHDVNYKESQDHSKWAVSDNEYYLVGDLNRMASQYSRGGGVMICKNKRICLKLLSIIKSLKKKKEIEEELEEGNKKTVTFMVSD